jgi:hypothetical protein
MHRRIWAAFIVLASNICLSTSLALAQSAPVRSPPPPRAKNSSCADISLFRCRARA